MSKLYKKTTFTPRALEREWINTTFQAHALFCDCDDPAKHFNYLINQQKCRHFKDAATTTETGGTPDGDDLTIDAGDLENLFAPENDVDEG